LIDQVARGDRDSSMQDILNTLDGGDTKQMNVISIFTTNHIEMIEPTFLRGKRIGCIINMEGLDAETAKEFIMKSFGDEYELPDTEELDTVCKRIEASNIVPAFMAEIIESVKANMMFEETNEVKAEYIDFSLESYLDQVELAATKDMTETPEKKLFNAFGTVMEASISPIREKVDYIADNM